MKVGDITFREKLNAELDHIANKVGTVKITPIEWEIIDHRLGVPCAIAESTTQMIIDVLSESPNEFEHAYTYNEIFCRAVDIESGGQSVIDWSNELDMMIIEDCCSGSTFFCNQDDAIACGDISRQKGAAYTRAADSVEKKTNFKVNRE